MGISQKIAALLRKRHNIEKEIAKLQKSCKHSVKSVKQVRENVDSSSLIIRYVCDKCSMILGYPNQQEIKKYLNG
tara:strand:- start:92 stop:316 length:225 start_codon:yes stop_codon:yes gene_type:complete